MFLFLSHTCGEKEKCVPKFRLRWKKFDAANWRRLSCLVLPKIVCRNGWLHERTAELTHTEYVLWGTMMLSLYQSIGKYLGPKVQETISSVSTLGMALYNGWKMTLVVLAGLPIIGLANRIQQNEADATVEPEGVEAVSAPCWCRSSLLFRKTLWVLAFYVSLCLY